MTAVQALDAALRTTEEWIDDLMRRLAWHGSRACLSRSARNIARITGLPGETRRLHGVHVPALLRGLFYEGWHPGGRGVKTPAGLPSAYS